LWLGRPNAVMVLRNYGVCTSSGLLTMDGFANGESQLKYVISSPGIRDMTHSFISSTITFLGVNIALPWKKEISCIFIKRDG